MALRDTERAVKIFKEVVSGRTGKDVGSQFMISDSRVMQIANRIYKLVARNEGEDIDWWRIARLRSDSDFWLKAADDYLINWRKNEGNN